MSKLDKTAHAANVLVSAGALAAADGLVPGLGAGIAGYLSLREVTKSQSPQLKALGSGIATELDNLAKGAGPDDPKSHLTDMILLANFSANDLISQKLDAKAATETMLRRIVEDAPRSDYNTDAFKSCFRTYVGQMLARILVDPDFAQSLQPQFMQAVMTLATRQEETLNQIVAMLRDHVERLTNENTSLQTEARELVQRDTFISGLSARYLADPDVSPEDALKGIEAALMDAAQSQQRGTLPSNADAAIKHTLERVQELRREDNLPEARETLAQAKANLKAEFEQEKIRRRDEYARLIDEEVVNARLENAPARAVEAELDRLSFDHPPTTKTIGARALEIAKEYERRANLFDGEVARGLFEQALQMASPEDAPDKILGNLATHLAAMGEHAQTSDLLLEAIRLFQEHEKMVPRALLPKIWALTQMNLGNALASLGKREAGTDRLEEAVIAYRAALEERTRDRVPLDWAMTQMNLGNALATLGEREAGTDRLEEAVIAYRAALEERTRDRVPLDWALTQMNLGNALFALGKRVAGTDKLEEAVTAYRAALEEFTRDRVPLDWAVTQMNLGAALKTLGEREARTDRLEEAVTAYRAALEERTRDRVPLGWAMTQMNLGNALKTLGEREAGTDRLEEAVVAYRAALEERTRDRVPLEWAVTQNNLADVFRTWFDITSDPKHLNTAQLHLDQAREVFVTARAERYIAIADAIQSGIDACRAG